MGILAGSPMDIHIEKLSRWLTNNGNGEIQATFTVKEVEQQIAACRDLGGDETDVVKHLLAIIYDVMPNNLRQAAKDLSADIKPDEDTYLKLMGIGLVTFTGMPKIVKAYFEAWKKLEA